MAGDGLAGSFEITVSGSTFSVTNMQVDSIPGTAASTFAQHFDTGFAAMSGTIDQTTGTMTLTPTDRLGSTSTPILLDNRWNVDNVTTPGKTTWESFTTGSVSNNAGTMTGVPITNLSDINGDTLDDFHAVITVASQVGTDWGTFTGASVIEVWSIDILSVSPNLADDSDAVTELTSKSINVLANDGGAPALTITAVTNGTLGTVAIDGSATSVTYTSTGGLGTDSFTYTVTDGNGDSNTATVNIAITGSPTVAVDDSFSTNQEQTITINLTANDNTSAGGETIDGTTVTASAAGSGATVADNNDGSVDYTPPAGFVGADTFTYTVQDTAGNLSNTATVTVTVAAAAITSAGNYAPGTLATGAGSASGLITASDIPVTDTAAAQSCVGGCYDFVITGAANPTTVVLTPLTQPVPADAVYRKLIGGTWVDFDTTTSGDSVASAPLSAGGGCPGASDTSWSIWNGAAATTANVGHGCLKLVIADNGVGAGPNDSDATPGTIADPGGIGTFPAANNSAQNTLDKFDSSESGGCTVARTQQSLNSAADWWLVGIFIGLLGWMRRRLTH
ncbi:MAG: hypothetical protein GXP11_06760 [Gammaproteobacteria bacterium]|nr:hypothetical protein [Gammaproteobacteria bacterium]